MFKRMLIMLIFTGILFGGIFGYHMFGQMMMKKHMASGGAPPVTVSADKAEMKEWQPQIRAVGSLRAVEGVDVSTEIAGQVQGIYFESGDEVRKGQVLIRLKADTEKAQLEVFKANADIARTVYDRNLKQLEIQAVSQAVVDANEAELKSRRAQLVQQQAVIAKTVITAPFDGKLGIRHVNPGQYLNPGETIVTLQSLDQLFVDFYLPQQELARLAIGQSVMVRADAYPGRSYTGTITAVNPRVEEDSRNVRVEALIPNSRKDLLPGMFVDIRIAAGDARKLLTLPQTAVSFNPYGETVYVVEEKGGDEKGRPVKKAAQRFITVGETRGDEISILKGIQPGDLVITSGQHKLRHGSTVIVNNQVPVTAEPVPKNLEEE